GRGTGLAIASLLTSGLGDGWGHGGGWDTQASRLECGRAKFWPNLYFPVTRNRHHPQFLRA
ncbi:MAG TPA: hypothetical protein VFG04_01610, partial [Planctomycetaceae bacterium]|nr:hypothetical protein [Planctomycetaceae bacterium]